MKFLFRLGRKVDSLATKALAGGFRLTGWKIFIFVYRWHRDILLSGEEMAAIAAAIRRRPGPLLVFGAGNDSALWARLNHGASTVFLEADSYWMKRIGSRARFLEIYHVTYTTRLADLCGPENESSAPTALSLPEAVRGRAWDLILVDAPQGWGEGPGRQQSIFEASRLVAPGGRIFVHDCDRKSEQYLTGLYLRNFRREAITDRLWLFQK